MIISDPIQMRIEAFGDASFSLLHEQYKNKATIKIGGKEFIATNVDRKFSGQETTDCGSNIQEFFRVKMPWAGEGLPPVGTVCELWIRANEWAKCQVIAMDEQDGHPVSVVRYGGGYYAGTNKCLRPIRTPEQIAADKREKDAEELFLTINWNDSASTWANLSRGRREDYFKAIDAGYRKLEIVDEPK